MDKPTIAERIMPVGCITESGVLVPRAPRGRLVTARSVFQTAGTFQRLTLAEAQCWEVMRVRVAGVDVLRPGAGVFAGSFGIDDADGPMRCEPRAFRAGDVLEVVLAWRGRLPSARLCAFTSTPAGMEVDDA